MCNEDKADECTKGGENSASKGTRAAKSIFEHAVRDFLGGNNPAYIKLTCLQCPSIHNLTKGFVLSLFEIAYHSLNLNRCIQ